MGPARRPRAALRWALSKLRQVVDAPDRPRVIADRERVAVDATDVQLDLWRIGDEPAWQDCAVAVDAFLAEPGL